MFFFVFLLLPFAAVVGQMFHMCCRMWYIQFVYFNVMPDAVLGLPDYRQLYKYNYYCNIYIYIYYTLNIKSYFDMKHFPSTSL